MRGTELIAHRGASHDAPENTLAAFRLAWEEGADGIEGDFRLTRDGEIVCLHDATTARTAGADIAVAGAALAELRGLDIPTLREVITTVPPGKRIFIELKSGPEILLPLAAVLAESPLAPEQTVILSFSEEVVARSRQLLPRIAALWITEYRKRWGVSGWTPSIDKVLRTLAETGASGLASQAHRSVDAAFVRALHTAGMELHVWAVDSPRAAARFRALGVDSIITNRPGWLRNKLGTLTEA